MSDLKETNTVLCHCYYNVLLLLNVIDLAEVSKIKHPCESLFCYSKAVLSAAAILRSLQNEYFIWPFAVALSLYYCYRNRLVNVRK